MKARKVLDDAVKVLKASPAIDHWQRGRERIEAEDLLWHVVGEEPDPKDEVSAEDRRSFDRLVRRRATGEPIPFIKGYAEFRGLELLVRPGVFVPRDASEFLAEQATRRLRKRPRPLHVDLATGAGTIALAVANEVPRATVVGTDLSADAVKLARKNAKRLGLRARFVAGDLFEGLPRSLAGTVDARAPVLLERGRHVERGGREQRRVVDQAAEELAPGVDAHAGGMALRLAGHSRARDA